jgi:hypothetical protein
LDLEDAHQTLSGCLVPREFSSNRVLQPGVTGTQVCADELVRTSERLVERVDGDAGLLDDPVDVHPVQALVIEKLVGGVEKTLTNRCPYPCPICRLGAAIDAATLPRDNQCSGRAYSRSTVGGDDQ